MFSFVTEAFEGWEPEGTFNLIISATAFHWVDPKVRYVRASEALESEGFPCRFLQPACQKG